MTMHTAQQLAKKLPAFKEFLAARGAEVLAPTSEWEVVRFRAGGIVAIVYRNAKNQLNYQGIARKALDAFISQGSWTAGVATKRVHNGFKRTAAVNAMLKRDGDCCFLCRKPLGDDITEEHLVPVSAGGPNHIANKALAHSACNLRMGHLSLMEKIAMRDKAVQP